MLGTAAWAKHFMSLGRYIKVARQQRGLSQWELSRLSGLGRSHISRLELDAYDHPSAETFLALSRSLKVHPNDLYQAAGYINSMNDKVRRSPTLTPEEALAKLEMMSPPLPDSISRKAPPLEDRFSQLKSLLVRGFHLEPDIREGDIIFVDPGKSPAPDQIVLYYHNEKIMLALYNGQIADGHVYGVVVGISRKLV
jgi:transcriptional regulator with XRE-family HTH domain